MQRVTAQASAGELKILMFFKTALSPCSFVSELLPLLKPLTLQSLHVALAAFETQCWFCKRVLTKAKCETPS